MRAIGSPLDAGELALVFAEARACVGIKWRHMGCQGLGYGHQTGLDCVHYLIRLVRACGRPADDVDFYERTSDGSLLLAEMDRQLGERVPRAEFRAGCVVMLAGAEAPHVGLLIERAGVLNIIHCCVKHGVIEHGYRGEFVTKTIAGWAL